MSAARYAYGWITFARVYRQARRKRHGAGPQPISSAIKTAACARYIVDGQHCNRPPRWMREVLRQYRSAR